ncbi:MAG: peroxiredoxin [Arenicella sp.]|nr:peroxiredoxin [Arenicella sp.]
MIQVGENIPAVSITIIRGGEQKTVAANDYFSGKKVVLVAVPGAFTPTCSESHLPGFVVKYDEVIDKGVDEVICLSVNDSFVMKSWQEAQNAEKITMLADGGATFTRSLGLEIDTGDFGGVRSRRYSMVIDNGVVTVLNAEEKTGFEVSDIDTLLDQL